MLYGEDLIASLPDNFTEGRSTIHARDVAWHSVLINLCGKGGPTVRDRRYDIISDVRICIHGLHSLVSLLFLCSQEAFVASCHSTCKVTARMMRGSQMSFFLLRHLCSVAHPR